MKPIASAILVSVFAAQLFAQVIHHQNIANLPSLEAGVSVTFDTSLNSAGVRGIHIQAPAFKQKGDRVGALVNLESQSLTGQVGKVRGQLGVITAWHAGGNLLGQHGESDPTRLKNFNQTKRSQALGGLFVGGPQKNTLQLNGVGSYWIGGVKGELRGKISGNPGEGAVAAVIGIDNAEGTADHYAGYFKGNVRVVGGVHFNGNVVHADYIFEDDYDLESIEEHAAFMWEKKHLPDVQPWTMDAGGQPVVEIGGRMKGILAELEKAHIYIEQLHTKLEDSQRYQQDAHARIQKLETRLAGLSLLVEGLSKSAKR